jgi:hypothetical protein
MIWNSAIALKDQNQITLVKKTPYIKYIYQRGCRIAVLFYVLS